MSMTEFERIANEIIRTLDATIERLDDLAIKHAAAQAELDHLDLAA